MGRVVIDTSTLVGAMLRPASKPRQALIQRWRNITILSPADFLAAGW
jgi:hypothetical protein